MADPEWRPRRDSQSTIFSLLHLDPSPIDSPEEEKDQYSLDHEGLDENGNIVEGDRVGITKGGSASAPGLSGSGRGAIYYCTFIRCISHCRLTGEVLTHTVTRIQKYSSYAMSVFTSLHLCNVSLIPATTGSVDASETYLLMTREIYQTSFAEPLLVALPFVAHVGSGMALRLVRRSQNVKRYGGAGSHTSPWPPLSWISLSGYALTAFYSAHVFTNRVLPILVEGDSSNIGLAYVAHGFARHPYLSQIAYVGLIATAAGHTVWGAARWLGLAPSTRGWLQRRKRAEPSAVVDKKTRQQRRRKWLGVHGVSLGVAALWAVGGLGVVARGGATSGWVGSVYDDLFARLDLW